MRSAIGSKEPENQKVDNMTEHILVPLDGSELAERALPLDIALARLLSSGITLLRAVPVGEAVEPMIGAISRAPVADEISAAREYLHNVGKRLEGTGLQVHTEIAEGAPAIAITEYAEQNPEVHLIAMATYHSSSHSIVFGSVAESVLRTAHKPVLIIRPTMAEYESLANKDEGHPGATGGTREQLLNEPAFHTIIVPLDGSTFAEEALKQARFLAKLTGASVGLVGAIPPPGNGEIDQVECFRMSEDFAREREAARLARYLADIARQMRAEGIEVLTEVVFGHPAEMILLAANRLQGDLIVMATRGRRDLERLWLGSVAQKLVQLSTLPVLLVRTPALRQLSVAGC